MPKVYTFCDYPFTLDVLYKSQLLEEEYKLERQSEQTSGIHQAIHNIMMQGGGMLDMG